MNFKTKCDEFLRDITVMRTNAISEAVQREIQEKHEPYKAQMLKTKDETINSETQEFNRILEELKREHEAKMQAYASEFEKAINDHRASVVAVAEETAKAEYDRFILKMSEIVDNTKLN